MSRFFSLPRNRVALRRLTRRLAKNRRGVALVEFAFVLPVMLAIYAGVVELGQGVMIDRKITDLTRALGDLTAQSRSTVVSDDEMNNIFSAADTIMMPFTTVKPGMVVTSVVIDGAGKATVCWSSQKNGIALGKGTPVALPAAMSVANTSVIMATASYEFEPTIGYVLTGKINIAGGPFYMRPRIGKAGGKNNIEQIERATFAMCPT